MKRRLSVERNSITVGLFILIVLTALVNCYPECPKYISELCKCNLMGNENLRYSCSRNNETISVLVKPKQSIEFNCENISDGQIYDLLNINNKANKNFSFYELKMSSCPLFLYFKFFSFFDSY